MYHALCSMATWNNGPKIHQIGSSVQEVKPDLGWARIKQTRAQVNEGHRMERSYTCHQHRWSVVNMMARCIQEGDSGHGGGMETSRQTLTALKTLFFKSLGLEPIETNQFEDSIRELDHLS